LRHDLGDQVRERDDAGGLFAAAEDLGLVDVVGGQVGEGAAAVVVVVDAHRPGLAGGQGGVAAAAGLDGGLLVGGHDVFILAQGRALVGAGVEVEHGCGPVAECRVPGEDPGSVLPGLERVAGQDPADARGRDERQDPAPDHLPGQFRARPARERCPGLGRQLAGQGFDLREL
jgi:hypothetical protein